MTHFDIVVVGSGWTGSLAAMIARRLGRSVLLLDKVSHPRFAIGESTSPLANVLLEQIANQYNLPALVPLCTYGAWKAAYPDIRCGLKRGFSFFQHHPDQRFADTPERTRQLLVAASPADSVADTHWMRADVDHFFAQQAMSHRAELWEGAEVRTCTEEGSGFRISGEHAQRPFSISCTFIVDASGPRGFASRHFGIPEYPFVNLPTRRSVFGHFRGVQRVDSQDDYCSFGGAPYPPDAAALHHAFDGGWMWVLRFDDGTTSAGAALTEPLWDTVQAGTPEDTWRNITGRYPSIADQMADAVPVRPMANTGNLSYRAAAASGPGWAMVPSAAAFVDPLFSTGFPMALLGLQRIGEILQAWDNAPEMARLLRQHSAHTLADADAAAALVAASYASFRSWDVFCAVSQIYFAAASFSEMARRLGCADPAWGFLARNHPRFGPQVQTLLQQALDCAAWDTGRRATFCADVAAAIAPLNIAGLADPGKRNWYGVDLQDTIRAADKLGFTKASLEERLLVAPWAQFVREGAELST